MPIDGEEVTEPRKPVEAVMVALEVEAVGKWENFDLWVFDFVLVLDSGAEELMGVVEWYVVW